ncbi:MAG: hypothetical protein ACK40G_02150 [Cytophagaceae bacterium]
MKKYFLYSVIAISGLLVIFNLSSFKGTETSGTANVPYVLVEIYEIPSYNDKGVHIHWGNGKTEIIPFLDFKADNHDDNGEILLNAVNKLTAQGYDIEHVASGLAQSGMITKLFMRKK